MSEKITFDLAGIRARAEAACRYVHVASWRDWFDTLYPIVAEHAAGMDPPTTLALVDEVERLRRERDEAHRLHDESDSVATDMMWDRRRADERADSAEAEAAKLRARVAELEGNDGG